MVLGFDLSLTTRAMAHKAPWRIAQLFATGAQGALFLPARLGGLFADEAGLIASPFGGAVARMADHSGQGRDGVQSIAQARPILGRHPVSGLRNVLTNSIMTGGVSGSSGTIPTGWSVGATPSGGVVQSVSFGQYPDGTPYYDLTLSGATGGAATNHIWYWLSQGTPASAGQVWTASADLELIAGSLSNGALAVAFSQRQDNASGVFVAASGLDINRALIGAGRQRFARSVSVTHSNTGRLRMGLQVYIGPNTAVNMTLRLSAPQMELGATASAYQRAASGFDLTQTGEQSRVYLLRPDGQSGLPAPMPALAGASYLFATEAGITLEQGLSVGAGAFEPLRGHRYYGGLLIDRALSAAEQAAIGAILASGQTGL